MICKEKPGDLELDFFYEIYQAPPAEKDWVLSNYCSLADCWNRLPAEYLIWLATRPHVLATSDQYRLAAYSSRMIKHLVHHPSVNRAIRLTETRARGRASIIEIDRFAAAFLRDKDEAFRGNEDVLNALYHMMGSESWCAAYLTIDHVCSALALHGKGSQAAGIKAANQIAKHIRASYKPRFNWKIHRRSSNYWGPPSLDPGVPEAAFQEVNPND